MKISLNRLKNYIDLSGITPEEIVQKVTIAGLEIEGFEKREHIDRLVVCCIEEAEAHPDADKLRVLQVFDGTERLQIVCGAPNARKGLTAVLAKTGAVLPGGFTIKETSIRGVKSCGMLVSEKEIGLSEDHSGIIELEQNFCQPHQIRPGGDASELLGVGDTIFHINITPNRGDCLSVYGFAREAAAVFERKLKNIDTAARYGAEEAYKYTAVEVQDISACPLYTAHIIRGVKIAPSPYYIQNALRSAGMRPINNVVDVTNFVMLEFGQPLHAFDLKVIDKGIVVRRAKEGEELVTLDGKVRKLNENITVIADHSKILAVAGVMGGEHSGIAADTVDILLECAYFDSKAVSYSAGTLEMATESAYRYSRGIDGGLSCDLARYAANLLAEVCGGTLLKGCVTGGFPPSLTKTLTASFGRLKSLLGVDISAEEALKIMERLSFKAECAGDTLTVSVPSARNDINHEADLAEELGRLYGLDRIPSHIPPFIPGVHNSEDKERIYQKELRASLAAFGFTEAVNFSFLSKSYLETFYSEEMVSIVNPLSDELTTLRPYIFPSLLKNLALNWNQGERSIRLFELSRIFIPTGARAEFRGKSAPAFEENLRLAFALMGSVYPVSWAKPLECDPFFFIKGVCENILEGLKLKAEYIPADIEWLNPGKSAKITAEGVEYGFFGALHPNIGDRLDLGAEVYIAELDFAKLSERYGAIVKYKKFSKFPTVFKDLSLVADKSVKASELTALLLGSSPLAQSVTLYDIYEGEGIGEGKRSMTFSIIFSSMDKTLTDAEINPLLMEMAAKAADKLGTKLR